MKDKRQRLALAWPYADPALAAYILHAAAASASNYPYNPAAASLYQSVGYYPHAAAAAVASLPPQNSRTPSSPYPPHQQSGAQGPIRSYPSPTSHYPSPNLRTHHHSPYGSLTSMSHRSPLSMGSPIENNSSDSSILRIPLQASSPASSSSSVAGDSCHHQCINVGDGTETSSLISPTIHSSARTTSPTPMTSSHQQPTLFQPYKETTKA